jgi:WD40 repeat protein
MLDVAEGNLVFRYGLVLVLVCGLVQADDIRVEVPAEPFECGHARTCCFDDTGRKLICVTQRGELLVWKDNLDHPVVTTLENKPDGGIFDRAPMSAILAGSDHVVLFYWDGRVQVWNVETCLKVKDVECDRKDFGYAYLSPDGQLVGVLSYGREGGPSAILFWNTRDWTTAGRIDSDERINDFCFTADGRHVLACVGHPTDQKNLGFTGIMSWNLDTREEAASIEYGSGFPIRITAPPDGRWVAVGGGDAVPIGNNGRRLSGHLRVFDWTDKDAVTETELYTLESDYVRSMRFSPDSKFLYGGASSALMAFRTGDWTSEWESQLGDGNPHEMSVSPNGKDILVPVSKNLQVIDAKDGTVRGTKLTFRF